jgi:MYXO-CTERM domain-containing protein
VNRTGARARLVAAVIAATAAVTFAGYAVVVHHVGAPKLSLHCVAPDQPSLSWYRGSGPSGLASAAEVHWAGSTEVGGCSESLTIGLATAAQKPGATLDRFVFGQHQHNLMGAVTGIYDQPDGKYLYLALAVIVAAAAARMRRRRAW